MIRAQAVAHEWRREMDVMAILTELRQRAGDALGRRMVRDGMWITAGHATVVLSGIIAIRVMTELAPAAVFGGANLLLGVMTLALNAGLSPLAQTQVRYHLQHLQAGNGGAYNRLIAGYAAALAACFSVAVIATLLIWPALRAGGSIWIIALIAPWAVATVGRAVLITPVHAERRMHRYAAWIATEAVLLMACTAIALAFDPSIEAFIAGQTIAIMIATFAFGRLPSGGNRSTAARAGMVREARAQIIRYGLPILPFAALGFAYSQSDRYVLAATLDMAAVGLYAAAFTIASRMAIMMSAVLNDVFRPALFEAETNGALARGQLIFRLWIVTMLVAMAGLVIGMLIFGDLIAALILAPDYRAGARNVMCLIALGYGVNMIAQVVENRLLSFGVSSTLIWTKLAGGGANIVLALALIPLLGVIGAAIANALGQLAMLGAVIIAWGLTPRGMPVPNPDQPEAVVIS